jgi:DNA-binding MurR/RpiR family transcriptional regulator
VVKFSQKLAFKGYPDLEYSIGESLARGDGGERDNHVEQEPADPHSALAERLWYSKTQAEQETRLINPSTKVDAIANAIGKAGKVFIIGRGEDGIPALVRDAPVAARYPHGASFRPGTDGRQYRHRRRW